MCADRANAARGGFRAGVAMSAEVLAAFQNARWYSRRELAHALGRRKDTLTAYDLSALETLAAEGVIEARRVKHIGMGLAKFEYRRINKE